MNRILAPALALLATVVPPGIALHDRDCTPGAADPATVRQIQIGGDLYYIEERNVPPPLDDIPPVSPIPGAGFLLGDGTWIYVEKNGLGGLQRGGISYLNQEWHDVTLFALGKGYYCIADPVLCVFLDEDPITDENCGHGPDQLIL